MINGKYMTQNIIAIALMILSVLMAPSCKQQSTLPQTPDQGGQNNTISVLCTPNSGGTGTEITVTVSVTQNQNEIKAFGFEMTFDSAIFQLQKIEKGLLCGSWAAVDGNEVSSGNMIVGGYMGSGASVPPGSSGGLAQIKFKVIYSGSDNNFSRQFAIKNYSDNIAGMTPNQATATFTFRK